MSLPIAILFCVITMLGWGSWANTQKLAGKEKWPFELFYWDYAIGVFLFSLLFATLGGSFAMGPAAVPALISGAIFNLANILLVVSIDAAGMSVAFPVGIGLALVIGTVESYVETPKGNPSLLFAGVALIVFAMIMSAASRQTVGKNRVRGLIFSIIAGCIMGLFYPQLMRAIGPGKLTPYIALVFFGAGVLASNVIVNTVFMKAGRVTYADYFRGTAKLHFIGVLGGCIWMLALCLNVIAANVAGPAISYALGQGATLVAAIWGVFVWREKGRMSYTVLMFIGYATGLILIGAATLD
ncbi:MAG TPA: GRP family sugar transporter [Bryobacteraceae bacterium]|jgi:glucose uptake protein|nr:GRP family sugar transporter [Bryobacteraceae bacterium]